MKNATMKLRQILLAMVVVCLVTSVVSNVIADDDAAAVAPQPGKQVAASTVVKVKRGDAEQEVTMRYFLFLPASYKADGDDRWPLLLFLHGSGERGDDLEKVKKHGPPKLVDEQSDFPFVTVSPQCPSDTRWQADELSALIDQLEESLRIDKAREYVTGLSMGGAGTWALIAREPERFAAAIPICGGGGGDDLAIAAQWAKLPLWVYYGDQDGAAGIAQAQKMIAAVTEAGNDDAHITIYPNVGHDSWTQTYANGEVYKWLLAHKKSK